MGTALSHGRRTRSLRAIATTGLVAVGGLGLAACGGGTATKTGAGAASAAQYVPAGTPIYIEASTDLSSSQWQQALELGKRFPGYQKVVAEAKASMAKEGTDFERDLRPLLGDSAALAITDLKGLESDEGKNEPPVLIVMRIADGKEAEVEALIRRGKDASVKDAGTFEGAKLLRDESDLPWAGIMPGALLLASSEDGLKAAISAHKSGKTIAGNDKLSSSFSNLPSEAIAQVFVDLGAITNIARDQGGDDVKKQLEAAGLGPDSAIAASLTAEAKGLRVKSVAVDLGNAAGSSPSFTPTLVRKVPANALAYIGMANLFETGRRSLEPAMAQDEQVKTGVQQARGALALLGVSVDDLKTLFSGESALVVTPGAADVPGIGAIMQSADGGAAQAILDRVREKVVALSQGEIPAFGAVELANGVKGWESKVDPKASVVYGVDGQNAIIGSSVAAVRELQAPTSALADDQAYKDATAQMPAKVTTAAWINGEFLWNTIEAAGGFKDAPPEALANLRPIRNLAAWSTEGDTPTFEAFLTIR